MARLFAAGIAVNVGRLTSDQSGAGAGVRTRRGGGGSVG